MRRPTPRPTGTVAGTVVRAAGRAAVLALAGALLTGPLALAPAAAGAEEDQGETGDEGIPRPFGDDVEPGTSFSDTAELGPGTYSVPVPEPGEDQYFEIPRTDPDDILWVGATLQLEEAPNEYASFTVEGTADGDSTQVCNNPNQTLGERSVVTTLFSANRTGECRNAETIVVRVANSEVIDEGEPVSTDAYYQLVVWSEPPVEDTSRLPAPNENSPWEPMEEPAGEPQEIEGSRTFSEATPLEDGYYTTTMRKGRPNIFAFPLTYGQHAQVLAEMDGAADYFAGINAMWVSPMGGELRTVKPSGGPTAELGLDRGDQAGWSTPIVTYTNRQRAGGVGSSQGGVGFADQTAAPAVFAGTYYLVLEIPVEFEDPLPDELPVILDVRTVTDYEGSPPDYATEPTALQALDGSGYVATESEQEAAREDEAEPAPWLLVVALFGGAAVLAVVGGVAVGRVVRSRS